MAQGSETAPPQPTVPSCSRRTTEHAAREDELRFTPLHVWPEAKISRHHGGAVPLTQGCIIYILCKKEGK